MAEHWKSDCLFSDFVVAFLFPAVKTTFRQSIFYSVIYPDISQEDIVQRKG